MRNNRTVFKIKCDRCGKEVEYGNGEVQHKAKGWLSVTIVIVARNDLEKDICPDCANDLQNFFEDGK